MGDDPRIQQFRKMAQDDPDNELGHFSLGKAYLEAGRYKEAIGPLNRVLELNAKLSKVYQLLGEAYDKDGQRDKAIEVMTRGVAVADEQGDRMPRDAMAETLRQCGAPVPAFKRAAAVESTGGPAGQSSAGFTCSRCGRPGGQLERPPFKGPLGQKVFESVCTSCWREWIPMGTKVINELGLTLASQAGQDAYDQYMIEFLQLEDR